MGARYQARLAMNARQHKRRHDARTVYCAQLWAYDPGLDGDPDEWVDDDPRERCGGDTMDPYTDYLLPCPVCMGEQRA